MSTPSPTPTPPIRLSIWRRVFDQISGGSPNQAKLGTIKKKPWFYQYSTSLFMFFGSFAVLVAPEIVMHLNGPPAPLALQQLQVRIVRTNVKNPHLVVELPDKSLRSMEWPVPISFRGEFRSYVWTDDQRERIVGCLATVRGAPLRWTIDDRFRVWELECPKESIHISITKCTNEFKSWMAIGNSFNFYFILGFYIFIFILYLHERRGNL